jgi:hypothetical protein
MNLKIFATCALIALVGSFAWNGYSTPKLTDDEYLRQYKVLNANNYSDEDILKLRANHEADSLKWKHTNKLLDDAMKLRGIEEKAMQKSLLQIQFYDAYYNHKASVEQFLQSKGYK